MGNLEEDHGVAKLVYGYLYLMPFSSTCYLCIDCCVILKSKGNLDFYMTFLSIGLHPIEIKWQLCWGVVSSGFIPKMNGVVQAANKNIKKIVKPYKDWHEMLPFSVHGYRTSVCTSTGATPFSLVYGMEAFLPIEVEFPSLRLITDVKLDEAEWVQNRFDQLNLIKEKKMTIICHEKLYQKWMKIEFDLKVCPQSYKAGDLVLKRIILPQSDPKGKWTPNYEGSYVVKKVFSGGAMMLVTMDGEDFPLTVNVDVVKKYFA
ncbi:hypothetical protein KIW84_022547 [Lathyrus oleraceus]|uniref:Uncharacterized protein n=1 Tax=Pisum sativum TaxID=3888 RepID=A0A9D4YEM7_PEA|nr:hypothetical protein KIW84_022547 [Pisum sativum]